MYFKIYICEINYSTKSRKKQPEMLYNVIIAISQRNKIELSENVVKNQKLL